jgi:hypothetical protein
MTVTETYDGYYGITYKIVTINGKVDLMACIKKTTIADNRYAKYPYMCTKVHKKNIGRIEELHQMAQKCENEVRSYEAQRIKADVMYATMQTFQTSELDHVTDHDMFYDLRQQQGKRVGEPKSVIKEIEIETEYKRVKRETLDNEGPMTESVMRVVKTVENMMKGGINPNDLAACGHARHFDVSIETYSKALKYLKIKPLDSKDEHCHDYVINQAEEDLALNPQEMDYVKAYADETNGLLALAKTEEEKKRIVRSAVEKFHKDYAMNQRLRRSVMNANETVVKDETLGGKIKATFTNIYAEIKQEICVVVKQEDLNFWRSAWLTIRKVAEVILHVDCIEVRKVEKSESDRVKRDVSFTGGTVEMFSENTPLRFVGAFISMLTGLGMSGDKQTYLSEINENRITINELTFNQHQVYNNTAMNRQLIMENIQKLKTMNENDRMEIFSQHVKTLMLNTRLSIEIQYSSVYNIQNAIQSIITTSKVGTTSTFSITALEIEKTKDFIYRKYNKRVTFDYDTKSEVRILNETHLTIFFYPEHDQELHTLFKITPIPVFEDGYKYMPATSEKYVAVAKGQTSYYRLTETENNECRRFRRCEIDTPSRSMKSSTCGIGSAIFNVAQKCSKTYSTDMEPFVQTIGNGTVYSMEKEITMTAYCEKRQDEASKAPHEPHAQENTVPKIGYFETSHDCTIRIKPYELTIMNRIPRTVETKLVSRLENFMMQTKNGIEKLEFGQQFEWTGIADLSKIKDIEQMPLSHPEWKTKIKTWAAGGSFIAVISLISIVVMIMYCGYRQVFKKKQKEMYTKVELNLSETRTACRNQSFRKKRPEVEVPVEKLDDAQVLMEKSLERDLEHGKQWND